MTDVIHICVAMKPLDGNFAQNALEHGVAGLNVDGCRIGHNDVMRSGYRGLSGRLPGDNRVGAALGIFDGNHVKIFNPSDKGRWPANVIFQHHPECVRSLVGHAGEDGKEEVEDWDCHEDCPVRKLDEQSGLLKSGKPCGLRHGTESRERNGEMLNSPKSFNLSGFGDSGGASRFFKVIGGEE